MKKVSFEEVLKQMLDEHHPFPSQSMQYLSNLTDAKLHQVQKIWPSLSEKRRISLLEEMEIISDSDSVPNFDRIAFIALKDSLPAIRALGIRLLWQTADPKLVSIFSKMLKEDPDLEVRAQATSALGTYIYLGEIEELPEEIFKPLESLLLQTLQTSPHTILRRRALEALGFSSRPEIPVLIREASKQNTSDWLQSALFAMGRSADSEQWANTVLSMLDHPNPQVQLEAVRAAGELELADARTPLLAILENMTDDFELRRFTIWSLSQIGGEQVQEALEKAYNAAEEEDDDEEMFFIEEALENLQMADLLNNDNFLALDVPQDMLLEDEEQDDKRRPRSSTR